MSTPASAPTRGVSLLPRRLLQDNKEAFLRLTRLHVGDLHFEGLTASTHGGLTHAKDGETPANMSKGWTINHRQHWT